MFERIKYKSRRLAGSRNNIQLPWSGQKSIIYLTVCLGYLYKYTAAIPGTLYSERKILSPVFSVQSCIAREFSAFVRY
jgi:hypothetical protein